MANIENDIPFLFSQNVQLSNAIEQFSDAEKRSISLNARIDQVMQSARSSGDLELRLNEAKAADEDARKWLETIIHTKSADMRDVFQKLKICSDVVACPDLSDENHSPVDRLITSIFSDAKTLLEHGNFKDC